MRPTPTTPPTTRREVARVHAAPGVHWVGDGFRVLGYASADPGLAKALDPFLLLDYHPPYAYPPTARRRGVGSHPHRGFETVTLAFAGSVSHHDSAGGGGTIGPGDVQWMSAASGVLHQEYHSEAFAREGGEFHMAQIWVNLPRARKMAKPSYHAITAAEIGVAELEDGAGTVRVIAGEYAGVAGPARPASPLAMFDVALAAGGTVPLAFPAGWNVAVLVMAGEATVNGTHAVPEHALVTLGHEGEGFAITAGPASRLLVLAGQPLDEPVVQYGPFVMNTVDEIAQAIEDFNLGRFGTL